MRVNAASAAAAAALVSEVYSTMRNGRPIGGRVNSKRWREPAGRGPVAQPVKQTSHTIQRRRDDQRQPSQCMHSRMNEEAEVRNIQVTARQAAASRAFL